MSKSVLVVAALAAWQGAAMAATPAAAVSATNSDAQPATTAQPSASADEATSGPDDISEVKITGSRIQREGFTSPTPVTTLSADELLT